jgi:hypothetical protein
VPPLRFRCAIALALAVVVAGCSQGTDRATDVAETSATLNGHATCPAAPGWWFFEWRRAGASGWTRGQLHVSTLSCPGGANLTRLSEAVGGLVQAAQYEFRLGFLTPNGKEGFTPPSRFTTAACGVTSTPGESFASLMGRLGSQRTACLAPGTYAWGDYVVPAGKAIRGVGAARVVGEARINNPNVTLADVYLQAAPDETHAVVDVKASGFTGQFLDIDGAQRPVQGVLVGSGSTAPASPRLLDSQIHGIRGDGSCGTQQSSNTHYHAVYWANSSVSGEIGRVWAYDIAGYGFHFYSAAGGSAPNVDVHNTVLDGTLCGRGHVMNDIGGSVTIRDSVLTRSGPVRCQAPGIRLANVRAEDGFASCPGTGLVKAGTTYQRATQLRGSGSRAAANARAYGNSTSGSFSPGPRF